MGKTALAFDIGGSKGLVGIITDAGEVLAQKRIKWEKLTKECVFAQLVGAARELMAENPAVSIDVLGASIPGLTDAENGMWVEACFSGIGNWPIAQELKDEFGLECYIENDANASAFAEKRFGGAKEYSDFIYLTVSNGVGGAAFCGGKMLRGATGSAMEIGHVLAVEGGRKCGCGQHGCLEMHAAGPGIALNYKELGGAPLENGELAQCIDIAARARAGEEIALKTFELEGQYLGRAIAAACNLLNPQAVFIGGGVSLVFDLYGDTLVKTMNQHMYLKANANVKVMPVELGYNGSLLGAAAVAFEGLN